MKSKFIPIVVMGILLNAVGATPSATQPQPKEPASGIAAKGFCFIAPDGGAKLHGDKRCRSLKKSRNIYYLSVLRAQQAGKGKKWNAWCKLCSRGHNK